MTFDILLRHTRLTHTGDGQEHSFVTRHVEAESEQDAFQHTRHSADWSIACIDSYHHWGNDPYSVDTGEREFFSDAHRPALKIEGDELRTG